MATHGLPIAARLGVKTIDELYKVEKEGPFPGEDDNLEFKKAPKQRYHYFSLVVPIPQELQKKISTLVHKAVEGWPKEVYYLQKNANYHLTLASNVAVTLNEKDEKQLLLKVTSLMGNVLEEFRSAPSDEKLSIKLTKLTISKASINCEADAGNATSQRFYDILKKTMKTERLFFNQSVTLCRFLMPPDDENQRKHNGPILDGELRKVNTDSKESFEVNELFNFDKLAFICTDRLADDFNIIHPFDLY